MLRYFLIQRYLKLQVDSDCESSNNQVRYVESIQMLSLQITLHGNPQSSLHPNAFQRGCTLFFN